MPNAVFVASALAILYVFNYISYPDLWLIAVSHVWKTFHLLMNLIIIPAGKSEIPFPIKTNFRPALYVSLDAQKSDILNQKNL